MFPNCASLIALGLLALSTASTHAAIPLTERDALIALYKSSNGSDWASNSHWCAGDCPGIGAPTFNARGTECSWYGVFCNKQQTHVVDINLGNNNLSGQLPSLGALTQVESFYVDLNDLTGPIPDLAGLVNLRDLALNQNRLFGPIPDLSGLKNLRNLFVGGNRLTGVVPPAPASLQHAWLCPNELTIVAQPGVDWAWNRASNAFEQKKGSDPWWVECEESNRL